MMFRNSSRHELPIPYVAGHEYHAFSATDRSMETVETPEGNERIKSIRSCGQRFQERPAEMLEGTFCDSGESFFVLIGKNSLQICSRTFTFFRQKVVREFSEHCPETNSQIERRRTCDFPDEPQEQNQ